MAPGRDRPYILAHIRMPTVLSFDHEPEPTMALECNLFADQPITIWRAHSKEALSLHKMASVLRDDNTLSMGARRYPEHGFYDFRRPLGRVEPESEYTDDGLVRQPSLGDLITLYPGIRCNVDVLDLVPQSPDASGTLDDDQPVDPRSVRGFGCQLLKDGQQYIFRLKKDRVIPVAAWQWGVKENIPGEWTLPIKEWPG